jgi:hypothetical protein
MPWSIWRVTVTTVVTEHEAQMLHGNRQELIVTTVVTEQEARVEVQEAAVSLEERAGGEGKVGCYQIMTYAIAWWSSMALGSQVVCVRVCV